MALPGNHRIEIPENRLLLIEVENKELRAKCERLETKLDLLAEKLDPVVRDYFAKNQPRTPRAQTRPVYRNNNTPETHGYFSLRIIYESYPEGIHESNLKEMVKEALVASGKNFNPSSFSAGLNKNKREGCIRKDDDGVFHYCG